VGAVVEVQQEELEHLVVEMVELPQGELLPLEPQIPVAVVVVIGITSSTVQRVALA
jgi:hypothetical protein